MRYVQRGIVVIQYDETKYKERPIPDKSGMLYSVIITKISDGKEVCAIHGDTILWNEFPIGNNINQSKGLTTMTIV